MSWRRLASRPLDHPFYPYCDHCNENLWSGWPTRIAHTEISTIVGGVAHFCSTDCRDAFYVIDACAYFGDA